MSHWKYTLKAYDQFDMLIHISLYAPPPKCPNSDFILLWKSFMFQYGETT